MPLPDSIELKAGETSRKISVTPINDTLVTGPESLTFLIVPNPAYRVAAGAIRMPFLDDDCPTVRLSIATGEPGAKGERAFVLTAEPPPARDTEVRYLMGGMVEPGFDYEPVSGKATIRAGATSAQVIVRPLPQHGADQSLRTTTEIDRTDSTRAAVYVFRVLCVPDSGKSNSLDEVESDLEKPCHTGPAQEIE